MKTICIHCNEIIRPGHDDVYCSSGLCIDCLIEALKPLYRKRQKREGYFDCFGTARGYCDQVECSYRRICIHRTI